VNERPDEGVSTSTPEPGVTAVVVGIDPASSPGADTVARLIGEALRVNGHESLQPRVMGWPPPAYVGPYLLTQWTDETRHAEPCDCDEDSEGVGARCMANSDWLYGVCIFDAEWPVLYQRLPRRPTRAEAPEVHRELDALSRRVVAAAGRCVERRLNLNLPATPSVARARREMAEQADAELHTAVSSLWEVEMDLEDVDVAGDRPQPSPGADLVARERQRQSEREGYTADHDARHTQGELAAAAWAYLTDYLDEHFDVYPAEPRGRKIDNVIRWPWSGEGRKPTPMDPIGQLAKIGALVAAEIDRLLADKTAEVGS
jgi:hypothetical protein